MKETENTTPKLLCTGLDTEGRGLVSWQGRSLAVPRLLEGETGTLRLEPRGKGIEVKLLGVEKPSPLRRQPPCPVFGKCGGCQLQHMAYAGQLQWKQRMVDGLLGRFCQPSPIVGMKSPTHYRNKVHAAMGSGRGGATISGVYRTGTHRIVPVDRCLIEDETADRIIATIRELMDRLRIPAFDEETGGGVVRHVLVRRGFASGQILVVLVASSPVFPARGQLVTALRQRHPDITSIVMNINGKHTSMVLGEQNRVLYGPGFIEDTLCGCVFRISPASFYQVNSVQTQVLYEKAVEFAGLTGSETVIDAYCGIGTIGLIAARSASRVVGVELNRDAVRDAVANARRSGITNARFLTGDAGQVMTAMAGEGEHVHVVFLDPPRSGCDEAFLAALLRLRPNRVVYVSCNPASMARDLAVLTKDVYRAVQLQPVDLFPHTNHVEAVCLLTLGGA